MSKPITPETIVYGFTSAGDADVSPDGTRITYTLARTNRETKKGGSQLWLCDIDGGNKRQLTFSGDANRMARWSPDGTQIAFISDRKAPNGIFVMPTAGGEASEVVHAPTTIVDFAWSPDSRRIAFVRPLDPANPSGDKPAEGAAPKVRVTSRIDYKQDNRGYLGDTRHQVFVVDVTSGEAKQITTDLSDHTFRRWSPDGRWLAAGVSSHNGMRSRLAIIPADGGETRLTGAEDGTVGTWAWSPDGARIVSTGDPGHTWQADFFVYDVAGGESRRVTTDLQQLPAAGFPTVEPPSMPAWLDGQRVLFHAVHRGASGLFAIDLATGGVEQVDGGQSVRSGMSVDRARRYVVQSFASLEAIGEITVFDRQEGASKVITSYSGPVFAETPTAKWERFDISRNGYVIEAWLLKPAGFDAAKKYPLVVDIHGGPNGYYGYAFNAIQQVLATNGMVVVYCNPRGSSSYGREFTQQVMGDWGGEDYEDIMAVVDEALKRPYCDPSRTGIWGYSYGGYMTAWTIAQNHRFKAAVCGAPCFDLESMYGTSDISHEFGPLQWGGAPHEAREWYATHSPSQIAHNTRTPTLIIQGEADDRCPVGQGEAMFVALKQAGCEVEFARYPGGSHLFMRVGPAEHREDVLARVLGWFQTHLDSEN
jgi:dipeptidyl aminopeptidase/acylaminoacyl peptidase